MNARLTIFLLPLVLTLALTSPMAAWSQTSTTESRPPKPPTHHAPHHHIHHHGTHGVPVIAPHHHTGPRHKPALVHEGARASAHQPLHNHAKAPRKHVAITHAAPRKPEHTRPERPKVPDNIGTVTGLPLPRFVSLKTDEVNMRRGPGERYPVLWVYKRRELPVEILREFDVWRLVEDMDGIKGWMHEATLTGRRGFIIIGTDDRTLRASPDDNSAAVAILKPGVIGHLLSCAAASSWCQVQVRDYSGWLPRVAFWGTLPGEAVVP